MMSREGRRGSWDVEISVVRVGDLVLTRADAEGSARLSRALHDARAASPHDEQQLPGKQAGLLAFLMRHHRQIVSKSRLIEAVWGLDGAAPSVVDVHMTRLRHALQRLDASGAWVRIETRRGMGYALHVDEVESGK